MDNETRNGANTSTVSNNNTFNSDIDLSEICDESVLKLLDEPFDQDNLNASKLRSDAVYNGFDQSSGGTWIYPTNLPIRQYQFNITRAALFRNTLVIDSAR